MPLSFRQSSLVRRLRRAVASRFLVALRRGTHRMASRLRKVHKERVLVVAPHADDEVIPCGGTLLHHARVGSTVRVVFVSDSSGPSPDPGRRAALAAVRRQEAAAVQEALGYGTSEVLGFPDGKLVKHGAQIAERIAQIIGEFRPTVIFCPFPGDAHGDHQAAALAVSQAAGATHWNGQIWSYEVWTALWPNTFVDISREAEAKAAAIRLYASQMDDRDYVAGTLGLNRFRGMRYGVEHAEAFFVCSPAEFATLCGKLDEFP